MNEFEDSTNFFLFFLVKKVELEVEVEV